RRRHRGGRSPPAAGPDGRIAVDLRPGRGLPSPPGPQASRRRRPARASRARFAWEDLQTVEVQTASRKIGSGARRIVGGCVLDWPSPIMGRDTEILGRSKEFVKTSWFLVRSAGKGEGWD